MNKIEQLFEYRKIIVLDGAMGTMLLLRGMKPGTCPESFNIQQPEYVSSVHREYLEAGSQVILTNSFGGTRLRLQRHNLETDVKKINRAAAAIAREAVNLESKKAIIGGSIGPIGVLMQPFGPLSFTEARDAFAEQAAGLAEGGIDIYWIETMSDLNEVKAAYEGVRLVSTLPIVATMSFDTHGKTMMGVSPVQAIKYFNDYEFLAVGANCGHGLDELIQVIVSMYNESPGQLLVAKANAGLPKVINNQQIYDGTPELMAIYARKAVEAGAIMIGACCGSTPAHIKAIADELDALQ